MSRGVLFWDMVVGGGNGMENLNRREFAGLVPALLRLRRWRRRQESARRVEAAGAARHDR